MELKNPIANRPKNWQLSVPSDRVKHSPLALMNELEPIQRKSRASMSSGEATSESMKLQTKTSLITIPKKSQGNMTASRWKQFSASIKPIKRFSGALPWAACSLCIGTTGRALSSQPPSGSASCLSSVVPTSGSRMVYKRLWQRLVAAKASRSRPVTSTKLVLIRHTSSDWPTRPTLSTATWCLKWQMRLAEYSRNSTLAMLKCSKTSSAQRN